MNRVVDITQRLVERRRENGEPEVFQHVFSDTLRTTWNPDDGYTYVEQLSVDGDWETRGRFKEPRNANAFARRLIKIDQ